MRIDEYVAQLRVDGELLAQAAGRVDLDQVPPTCPEWTVRELVRHQGRVHRWAASYVRDRIDHDLSPDEEYRAWGDMPVDAELLDWFRAGHASLVDVLAAAPSDVECWTFLPAPSPLAFWARRQAHETSIHRADAQSAVGAATGTDAITDVPADFAVDGIDELLIGFFGRPGRRLSREVPATLLVRASDAGAAWLVTFGPDGARAQRVGPGEEPATVDCQLVGPASRAYQLLWNRRVDGLEVRGDERLLELWRERARISWA
jgi:uncharacterized protein (TIGR03083 family)